MTVFGGQMKKLGKIANSLAMTSFVLAFIQNHLLDQYTFDEYIIHIYRIELKNSFQHFCFLNSTYIKIINFNISIIKHQQTILSYFSNFWNTSYNFQNYRNKNVKRPSSSYIQMVYSWPLARRTAVKNSDYMCYCLAIAATWNNIITGNNL